MARAKKSSLDIDEPVIVQDEEFEDVPVLEEPNADPMNEPVVEKVVIAEAQNKTVGKKKRGVKICVI